jgi:DNA-binding response OmpR family regulator
MGGPMLENRRVLLVEDDYLQAREATLILQRARICVVGPVATVSAALSLIEQNDLCAAILDINLGSGPSFEIADRLRAHNVPLAFLTGYDRSSIPEEYAEIPRAEKPVVEAKLLALLIKLCG